MRELQGKTVFLTGAASGIGRQLASQLADAGCHLLLVDRDEEGLNSLVAEVARADLTIRTYVCDLAQSEQIHQTVSRARADADVIDILINNAGVAWYGATHRMTQDQWDWLMSINLQAPIQITQLLLPELLQRPDAHIVNMCSISGLVAGGRFAAYHTSKFGLVGLTEALRAEYGRSGIGVTAVCPGPVLTDLYRAAEKPADSKGVPQPPPIVCATPEQVAARTIRAIRRNQRMVLITPMAHALFQIKRFLPGLLDAVSSFSRSKKRRRQERIRLEEQRLAMRSDSADSRPSDSRAA